MSNQYNSTLHCSILSSPILVARGFINYNQHGYEARVHQDISASTAWTDIIRKGLRPFVGFCPLAVPSEMIIDGQKQLLSFARSKARYGSLITNVKSAPAFGNSISSC